MILFNLLYYDSKDVLSNQDGMGDLISSLTYIDYLPSLFCPPPQGGGGGCKRVTSSLSY